MILLTEVTQVYYVMSLMSQPPCCCRIGISPEDLQKFGWIGSARYGWPIIDTAKQYQCFFHSTSHRILKLSGPLLSHVRKYWYQMNITLPTPQTDIAPEKRQSQKKSSLPSTTFNEAFVVIFGGNGCFAQFQGFLVLVEATTTYYRSIVVSGPKGPKGFWICIPSQSEAVKLWELPTPSERRLSCRRQILPSVSDDAASDLLQVWFRPVKSRVMPQVVWFDSTGSAGLANFLTPARTHH